MPAKEPILINYFSIPIHSKINFYSTNFTILVCDWCLGSSARRCKLCHSKSQVQTNSVWSRKCWRYFITFSDPTVQELDFNGFCFSFRYCVQCWRNDRRLGYISSFEVTNSRLSRYICVPLKVSEFKSIFFLKLHCPQNERNVRQHSSLWS